MEIKTWLSAIKTSNQDTHGAVYNALNATKEVDWWTPAKGEQRILQFRRSQQDTDLIYIRSNVKPPESFPSKEVEHTITAGDTIRLSVVLCASFRHGLRANEQGTDKPKNFKMTTQDKIKRINSLLTKAGLEVCFSRFYACDPILFVSKEHSHRKPAMLVKAKAKIVDEKAFETALKYGIDNFRGYGFGMIEYSVLESH